MKVLRSFRDKTDNLKRYEKGSTYTHKNKERTAFLVKEGFIEGEKD